MLYISMYLQPDSFLFKSSPIPFLEIAKTLRKAAVKENGEECSGLINPTLEKGFAEGVLVVFHGLGIIGLFLQLLTQASWVSARFAC